MGRSTGSIIGLHLANHKWSSGSCSAYLERICKESFDRSQVKILPTFSRSLGFFPKHRYHSKGLQAALKNVFTDKETLVDTQSGQGAALKVAVVAGGVVFTNYRYSSPSRRELTAIRFDHQG
jgi:patatin-like phospholipase/acyl hydrolase